MPSSHDTRSEPLLPPHRFSRPGTGLPNETGPRLPTSDSPESQRPSRSAALTVQIDPSNPEAAIAAATERFSN